ncbi:DUF1302 family protein [Flagellimonas sp.]|uniref:DUF1302 family protein n=1 Tax=Flagellimonas sp. TaxID=2058762 RepID=UPI003B52E0BA
MKISKILPKLFLLLGLLGLAQEQPRKTFWDKLNPSLVVATETSYEFDSGQLQKSEWIIKPELTYKFNRRSKLVFRGQMYSEFMDNLEAGIPDQHTVGNFNQRLFLDKHTNLELRELYYHARLKGLGLTLGKQQIVWGETDGIKLLDVVNPQNFREFILDDFEDSRIPLWSVKAEFDIKDIGVQLVWIPDNTYHITQDFDAPFFTKSLFPSPPEGVSSQLNTPNKPGRFFMDSDFGVKLTSFTKGWDLSLNYLYYYDDLPAFYSNFEMVDGTPTVSINPEYERQQLLGGTFNKVFGSSTFRGELAYVFGQNFISDDSNALSGVEESDFFRTALGVDFIKGEYVVSGQLFNEWVMESISPFNRERWETNLTLLGSREFLNDSLKAEVLWVHSTNHGDGYVTPRLSYWLNTNTQLLLNAHAFYGNESQLFGQFKDRSRISFGLKWGI